jgi:hypothetical protein
MEEVEVATATASLRLIHGCAGQIPRWRMSPRRSKRRALFVEDDAGNWRFGGDCPFSVSRRAAPSAQMLIYGQMTSSDRSHWICVSDLFRVVAGSNFVPGICCNFSGPCPGDVWTIQTACSTIDSGFVCQINMLFNTAPTNLPNTAVLWHDSLEAVDKGIQECCLRSKPVNISR